MAGPVQDRLRLLRATATHLRRSTARSRGRVRRSTSLLACDRRHRADVRQLVDEQGVTHRLWTIAATSRSPTWLAAEPLLIADGHHRYTTALRTATRREPSTAPGRGTAC